MLHAKKKDVSTVNKRLGAESNRHHKICNLIHYHYDTKPVEDQIRWGGEAHCMRDLALDGCHRLRLTSTEAHCSAAC